MLDESVEIQEDVLCDVCGQLIKVSEHESYFRLFKLQYIGGCSGWQPLTPPRSVVCSKCYYSGRMWRAENPTQP